MFVFKKHELEKLLDYYFSSDWNQFVSDFCSSVTILARRLIAVICVQHVSGDEDKKNYLKRCLPGSWLRRLCCRKLNLSSKKPGADVILVIMLFFDLAFLWWALIIVLLLSTIFLQPRKSQIVTISGGMFLEIQSYTAGNKQRWGNAFDDRPLISRISKLV